jgi:hypothetical protein
MFDRSEAILLSTKRHVNQLCLESGYPCLKTAFGCPNVANQSLSKKERSGKALFYHRIVPVFFQAPRPCSRLKEPFAVYLKKQYAAFYPGGRFS